VRTDHGTKYAAFDKSCRQAGLVRQYSAPYTPAQNRRAKRLNRTIIEKTRALPLQHRSPKVLWPEAVQVACQLRNYTLSADQECTPHELLYGSKPDVARLPVFGCAVSVHIPKKHRHELAAVSAQGIFVGYVTSSKACRAFVSTGYNAWKVIESANVSFEAHIPGRVQPF
jgi:transposase InsO family protein